MSRARREPAGRFRSASSAVSDRRFLVGSGRRSVRCTCFTSSVACVAVRLDERSEIGLSRRAPNLHHRSHQHRDQDRVPDLKIAIERFFRKLALLHVSGIVRQAEEKSPVWTSVNRVTLDSLECSLDVHRVVVLPGDQWQHFAAGVLRDLVEWDVNRQRHRRRRSYRLARPVWGIDRRWIGRTLLQKVHS